MHGLSAFPSMLLSPYWGQYGQLYRPITQLSLSVDWSLGAGAPWVFHLTNVVLNALVVFLVARLALRWLPPIGAAAAAGVFAIHPVHVEAVANVVGRSELLCAAALLAVMLLATSTRFTGARRFFYIALASALALGSKETGALAPVLAWAAAITFAGGKRFPGTEREDGVTTEAVPTVPWRSRPAAMAAAAAACGVIPLLLARVSLLGALTGDRPHPAFGVASMGETYALALASSVRVAGLLFAPQVPRIDYSPTLEQIAHQPLMPVLAGALLVIAALAAAALHVRRPHVGTLAVVIAAVTFAPVSNIAFRSGLIVAERTLYSPSIGFALLAGLAATLLCASRAPKLAWFAALWVIPAVAIAQLEIPVWKDSVTVYETIRVRAPDSYKAHFLVGNLRVDAGRMEEASREYATSIALFDADPQVLYAAGAHAMRVNDRARALAWLGKSVEMDPRNRRARGSLVRVALATGDTTRARVLLAAGLEREPEQRVWRALLDSLQR